MSEVINLTEFRKRINEEKTKEIPAEQLENPNEIGPQEEIEFITDEEVGTLVEATIAGHLTHGSDVEDEDIFEVITWAQEAIFRASLVEMILGGELIVRWDKETRDCILTPRNKE